MKTLMKTMLGSALMAVSLASAAFEMFQDYTPSKEVYNVTFVKVKPNRISDYLEGLKQTWAGSCEAMKKSGRLLHPGE